MDKLQQFLYLYKMRYGGYPGAQEQITNEEVIKISVNFARGNKKTFKKYFPSNKVTFEDNADYSKDHPLGRDPNF